MNEKVVDEAKIKDDDELLGYQHFLYNVNIEYSPGGNRPLSVHGEQSFKLKCLPYMLRQEDRDLSNRKNSLDSSNNSICDQQPTPEDISSSSDSRYIDVTRAKCAFLGNSDYVPSHNYITHRRVVLELISAKLSQPTILNTSSSYSSGLASLPELQDTSNSTSHTTRETRMLSFQHNTSSATNSSAPTFSSKRFVNYTLLIKTAPGLDKFPAVIERRFSDFLLLYQSLKSRSYAKFLDSYVTFPKKVYMGNFSLTNIAERSIEFARLLNLCVNNTYLLWSVSFISFLMDKELKEAHRLSLCGDHDDLQATIEITYRVQQKLYLATVQNFDRSNTSTPHNTTFANVSHSPVMSNRGSMVADSASSNEDTISTESRNSNSNNNHNPPLTPNSLNTQSEDHNHEDLSTIDCIKASLPALNQRILVTFCIMFLAYYRDENYEELKQIVQNFSQLISSQEYVHSIVNTRHYTTLRACLLFLMNMNKGNIIEEEQRLWLKQSLEEIDGAFADNIIIDSPSASLRTDRINGNGSRSKQNSKLHRITKRDLSSLLKDRNFCTFQDGDINR